MGWCAGKFPEKEVRRADIGVNILTVILNHIVTKGQNIMEALEGEMD
jgi:hypothetical protein